jgi:hypothetical protein
MNGNDYVPAPFALPHTNTKKKGLGHYLNMLVNEIVAGLEYRSCKPIVSYTIDGYVAICSQVWRHRKTTQNIDGKTIDKRGLGTPRVRCETINMKLKNLSCEQSLRFCPMVNLLLAALNKFRIVSSDDF